jgi:molybdopterin converting factor small subunit
MDSTTSNHTVRVLAFGQVGEQLGGRHHEHKVEDGTTIRDFVMTLGLESWIQFGLSVAVNGSRCDLDTPLSSDVELALLPPVSGG